MPDETRFWNRFLSIGVRPEMGFDERRRLHVLNGAALATLVLASLFLAVNLANRRHDLAFSNFCGVAVNAAVLLLLHRGWVRTATVLLLVGMTVAFTLASLAFRNGVDFYLLLLVSAPLLVLDSLFWRRFTAVTAGTLFVVIQALHFEEPAPAKVTLARFLLNTAVFVASLYWYNAIFRSIHDHTRAMIVEKNAALERQRLQLEAEHAKLMDQTARLDEANAAKERLFSIVGHDLRGPVGNVKEALNLLEDGTLTLEEFAEIQRDLRQGIDRVHASLENLMEWSAAQMGALRPRPERVPLREAAAEAAGLLAGLARDKAVDLVNDLPAGAAAWADMRQLESILRNLLSNAVKFTPPGGRVDLAAREEGEFWRVTVRDTGVGMPPERAAALFRLDAEPRSTLGTGSERGLGLGLQICRDFARANGAALSAESAPGRGSAFHLIVPRA